MPKYLVRTRWIRFYQYEAIITAKNKNHALELAGQVDSDTLDVDVSEWDEYANAEILEEVD